MQEFFYVLDISIIKPISNRHELPFVVFDRTVCSATVYSLPA